MPHTGVMVALFPDEVTASDLALTAPDATPPSEMHVTIAFFGEADLLSDAQLQSLADACSACAAGLPPVSAALSGYARFGGDSEDGDPYVMLVDSPDLLPLRAMLLGQAFDVPAMNNHGFTAHMTLAYVAPDVQIPLDHVPVRMTQFRSLSLVVRGARQDFPFTGASMRAKIDSSEIPTHAEPDSSDVTPHSHPRDEVSTVVEAEKAKWSAASVNDLPDSSFLFIGDGGQKGDDGKTTPRSLRYLSVKDADGNVDVARLREAIDLIPQLNLASDVKETLASRAKTMLEHETKLAEKCSDCGMVAYSSPADSLSDALIRMVDDGLPDEDILTAARQGLSYARTVRDSYNTLYAPKSAAKAGRRVAGSWLGKLQEMAGSLADLVKWASYADQNDDDEEEDMDMEDMPMSKTFFVTKDATGATRWLSFSSNAFEDREREIVSTKALEGAVDAGDRTEERGTLRVFHVPGTDIGVCDFQAIEGRFLVESGTFYDTELARKAIEFLETTDEPLGTSIGFLYPEEQFKGGVYERIHIVERSVCPLSAAANPWTAFQALSAKGVEMDKRKSSFLGKMFGDDDAARIISTASAATKELESTARYKSTEEPDLRTQLEAIPDEAKRKALLDVYDAQFPVEKDDASAPAEDGAPVVTDELIDTLKTLLEPIVTAVKSIDGRLIAVEEKAEKAATTDENVTTDEPPAPRGAAVFGGHRVTEGDNQKADKATVEELLKGQKSSDDTGPANPILPYVLDLVGVVR